MKKVLLIIFTFQILHSNAQIISTFAGNGLAAYGGDNGPAINASLNYVGGLVFDSIGNLYCIG